MIPLPVEPRVTEYLYRKAAATGVPLSGTFELTPVCNMACKMCYVRLSPKEQEAIAPLTPAAQWVELGRKAKEAGMLYLLLTGGEPFSHPDFREILEGLHALGLIISINSNGTLIDVETVEWLKTCPPVRINISLYGSSDETYRRLCGNPGGYSRVTRAVALLKEAGIPVKLNCSLTPHNARDLPEMAAYAEKEGLAMQIGAYMFPPIRRDSTSIGRNDRFSPEDAAWYTAYADLLTLGRERFLAQESMLSLPDPEADCSRVGDGIRCRAGKCSFWVTWQGDMTPCGMFPCDGSPNLFREEFGEAWEQVKTVAGQIRLPSECAGCKVKDSCRACAAMVVTESGCFDKVPQYRCDMMRAYPGQWRGVKEEML